MANEPFSASTSTPEKGAVPGVSNEGHTDGRVVSKIIAVVVLSGGLGESIHAAWKTHPHLGAVLGFCGGVLLGECFPPRMKPLRLLLVLAAAAAIALL